MVWSRWMLSRHWPSLWTMAFGQWLLFTTSVIEFKKLPMTGDVDDGHIDLIKQEAVVINDDLPSPSPHLFFLSYYLAPHPAPPPRPPPPLPVRRQWCTCDHRSIALRFSDLFPSEICSHSHSYDLSNPN